MQVSLAACRLLKLVHEVHIFSNVVKMDITKSKMDGNYR